MPSITFDVRWPTAASVSQALPACPWFSCQGWKWSLAQTLSKPARSASTAESTKLAGENCSWARKYPIFCFISPDLDMRVVRAALWNNGKSYYTMMVEMEAEF